MTDMEVPKVLELSVLSKKNTWKGKSTIKIGHGLQRILIGAKMNTHELTQY